MKKRHTPLQELVGAALRGEAHAKRYFRELGRKAALQAATPATRAVVGTLQLDIGSGDGDPNDLFLRAATYLGLRECGQFLSGQE